MKIVVLTSMFPPKWLGGVEMATWYTAKYLAGHGHEVYVITSWDKGTAKVSQEDNFFLHRINYPKIKFLGSIIFGCKIFLAIRKINPEIIHCQRIQMGIPAFLYKKYYKTPYIVWCHGDDVYFSWKFKKIISRFVLDSAGTVIALTNNMKERLADIFRGNTTILPNGISLENLQRFSRDTSRGKFNIRPEEKIIIFVGGLKSIKGVRYLIEAFKSLSQVFGEARLLLIGDGEDRQNLQDLVDQANVGEKVDFLGKIPNEKVLEYMAASDVFVLPSLFETFGIVNLEAMALGLPIVASRVYGIPEVVEDGKNGFLVEPKNANQLFAKIELLFKDKELSEKISQNNKEKAKQYDWELIILKLEKIYSHALNNKYHV